MCFLLLAKSNFSGAPSYLSLAKVPSLSSIASDSPSLSKSKSAKVSRTMSKSSRPS